MLLLLWSLLDTSGVVEPPVVATPVGEVDLSPKRYYVRRRGRLYLFNTAQEADSWIDADDAAKEAIEKAQTSSKRRRIARKVQRAAKPLEVVDIDSLPTLASRYQVNLDVPRLMELQNFDELMRVRALILQMQDDEDVELLLLA
jgi:hypothetical protein